MSKKHKQIYATLIYVEHLPILSSAVTGRVSISAFASLVGIPTGIRSYGVGIKICATTVRIKNYTPTIKKPERERW